MNLSETMQALEAVGTAQNRKVYARHGVGGAMFGVSYAELGKLKKKIKTDHALACELWATGNHDARVLATMIADPSSVTAAQLDAWAKSLTDPPTAGALATLAARTRHAKAKIRKWTRAKAELTACAGWSALVGFAKDDAEAEDAFFLPFLETIEREIHGAKNRVREAMNRALISIGARSEPLRRRALQAARVIGQVEVDHGETGCKTPDAAEYIEKTWKHKAKKGMAN